MSDNYDDFELPMDFHEAPDVHDLALGFWREQGRREPKRQWWRAFLRWRK